MSTLDLTYDSVCIYMKISVIIMNNHNSCMFSITYSYSVIC